MKPFQCGDTHSTIASSHSFKDEAAFTCTVITAKIGEFSLISADLLPVNSCSLSVHISFIFTSIKKTVRLQKSSSELHKTQIHAHDLATAVEVLLFTLMLSTKRKNRTK